NNDKRFSKTIFEENSDSEYSNLKYSNLEYSSPELLIYELENSNEENFSNEKIELTEEEAKQLIYKNNEMLDLDMSNLDIANNSSISKQLDILNNRLKDVKNMNAYEYLYFLAALLGMLPLHKKGIGKALIVSEFLTETCGHLTITLIEISELNLSSTFLQKAQWNASDLLILVNNKAISIFEATYSNCVGVFVFDNSTNHNAFASDALCVKHMNLYSSDK
ncbi:6932_t:CDS:2, partial [Cetraspora pellucida]